LRGFVGGWAMLSRTAWNPTERGFVPHLTVTAESPSTPSKFPTTRSPVSAGRARSIRPRPLSGGTPPGSVSVPRLMSPTKARRTRACGRGGGGRIGAGGGDGGEGTRIGRTVLSGLGAGAGGPAVVLPPHAAATATATSHGPRRVTPPTRPCPSAPRRPACVRCCARAPPPPAAHSPARTPWSRSAPLESAEGRRQA
jgi:hypothetical protein